MDKVEMINKLFWLLENNGETGVERILDDKIPLPFKSCIKYNIKPAGEESLVCDVFRSDTPSRIAVNNINGITVDWLDLNDVTRQTVFQRVQKKRSDEYQRLTQILNNMQDVRCYLEEDLEAICDDTMREYAESNLKKADASIQMILQLMK